MGIVRPVMAVYPWAWAFFVPFILITSFAVLNLVVAVIVNAMQVVHEAEQKDARAAEQQVVHDQMDDFASEIRALRQELGQVKSILKEVASAGR